MSILETKDLRKIYGSGETEVRALDGVNLQIENGEFVAIVGTSGSGKSTLLHMLGGLDRPTDGKVFVDGKDIFSLKEEALTIFRRRKIGFVFQSYNLVPVLNVYENIVLPIELDGGKVNKEFVQRIVQTLGLDGRLDALPSQLSGGQRQRLAIARAMLKKPDILILDEATSSIDTHTERMVQEGIAALLADRTSFVIAHRLSTMKNAKNILVLGEDGIKERGTHEELMAGCEAYRAIYHQQTKGGEQDE